MDFKLNEPVECLDGVRGGHVTGIIVNPETDEFTHLIIKTEGVERVVPALLIRDTATAAVLLNCTLIGLKEQPPLIETEYVRSVVEHYDSVPSYSYTVSGSYHEPLPRYDNETYTVKHDDIPLGEMEIKRGMAVFAEDGRVGHVDDVVVDRADDQVTQIVLRQGHLWGAKEVVIDIALVKSVQEDGIYLKVTKAQVARFQLSLSVQTPTTLQDGSMDIPVHARVHCTDGDFGHSTCLIINPINDSITHFVVNDSYLTGKERIVPVSFITSSTDDSITVNCDRATLALQPDFIEYDYERLDKIKPYRAEHIYWPMMITDNSVMFAPEYVTVAYEQIPVDELGVRRGMAVNAIAENEDEKADHTYIGQVEAFVADPKTGHITHLVLRKGHLWGQRDVTIPVSGIGKIEANDIQLKLTKQEIKALPAVPVTHWMPLAQ